MTPCYAYILYIPAGRYRRLRSQDPELSARVGTTDLSLGVYYHLHMQHAIRGTFPDLLDNLHRRCCSKKCEAVNDAAESESSSTVQSNASDVGAAHADAGSCCGVYREDCDLDASALRDYTDAFPFAKAAYFPHEEEIQWNVQQFGFDAVVAHSQSATDPLPSYCVLVCAVQFFPTQTSCAASVLVLFFSSCCCNCLPLKLRFCFHCEHATFLPCNYFN